MRAYNLSFGHIFLEGFPQHSALLCPLCDLSVDILAKEHLGNIQGTFREHSGNIQGTFREHSGKIQGPFRES
jgi:hypothetical protein